MSESFQAAELSSLVEMLKLRVRERPDQLCFRFLTSGDVDGPHEEWTYAMLDAKARAVAFELASVAAKGQRALLVYAPGLDFIAAFLGCAYAGVVAVPVYPPDPTRLDRTLPRLRAIAAHSESTLLLTTSAILQMRGMVTPLAPELASARWIATDTVGEALNADFEHAIGADTLAFLQYTSGSTGQPKGVMITHGNLLDNQRRIARAFGTDASTHVVGWLPVFHDMGLIGNVLHPLFLGASCTLLSPIAFLQRPLRWLEAISRFRGTTSGGPNFAYDLCARKVRPEELARLDLSTWTVAFNGAEPVRKETLDRFSATFARAGFQARAAYPCYGLAEATLFVSGGAHDAPPGHLNLSTHALARNIVEESSREGQDTRLVVSTGHHHPEVCLVVDPVTRMRCPADAVGEIWVSGASVAKGYWNDPEETAATFEARLSGTDDPRTFLRTGDLGFMTRGELFVTGRLKDLIILRGRNLYPQDVELTVERAHLAVRPGCVAAFAIDAGGQEQLAVLAEADLRAGQAEPGAVVAAIRRHVADEHGARASTVVLLKPRTIPKTSSGKIQRRASRAALIAGELEVIFSSSAEDTEEAAAPAVEAAPPPLHVALAASYAELRRSAIREFVQKHVAKALGVDASAVDLAVTPAAAGLDSLMMLELQDAAERELGTSVPSMLLWQCQSLTEFAEQLASGGVETERVAAEDAAIDADGALSSGQRRLWFLAQLNPGSAAYNVHFGFRIHGPIDAHLLQLALHELAKRCEQLRTIFVDLDGEPRSVVQQEGTIPLVGIDLGTSDPARLAELSAELSAQPFTLSTGPLTRAHLVATARDQHVLLLTQHHIVTDGWSAAMLGAELVAIYAALAGRLPLPIFRREPFTTFVRRERAQSEAQRDQHVFWRRTLAELPRLELPADRPVPARRTEHGGRVPLPLPRNTVDSLLKFGRARGCTPFVTLLSVYQLLLFRYTGQEDFAVGSVCANRNRSKARSIVGLLANTIALRCDLAGAPSFDELLQRTRTRVAAALENCELPFAEVVSAADVPRDRDENPIFQASFVLETVSSTVADAGGVTWEPFSFTPDGSVPSTSKFDLSFTLAERDQTFSGMIEYSRDRFDSETVERMAAHWHTLLDSVAQNPTRRLFEFELLPTAERRLVVSEQETTLPETDVGRCFHQLFEEQALATPDALAIAGSGPALTYAELNRRSNRLASHLRRRGVGPDAIVGLLLPRSSHFLAAMLAVFKAGGAYLPLDPEHTGERNLRVLRLSGARHLIATRELLASLPTDETAALGSIECFAIEDCDSLDEASDNLPPLNVPGHLAYVIYTSGSTGLPKGAMVEHAGMLNHLRSKLSVLDLHAGDVLAQTASQSFDISVWQFLAPLLVGGRVQVYSTTVASDPFRLFREVAADQVTILEVVPSLLRAALDDLDSNVGVSEGASVLRWLMLTGEALPPDLARTWLVRNPSVPIINAYGPTECSDDVTHHIIRDPAELNGVHTPIGRAIQNCRLYVLDRAMQPVPLGVAGELYIGGVCVGRGYLHDPARTAQAFVPDPLGGGSGDRLYCTGDRVIRRPNGELEFLGRSDYQVKVRGYRIELGEIESVLEEQVGVSQAVVVARGFGGGDKRLVGYVVLSGGVSSVELRRVLRQRLPEYMVPTWLVELDSLPLTSNGKVDRRALPEPKEREVDAGDWEGLSSPVTELLSQIWSEVLGRERVGLREDFFELGGHSLLATQVMSRVRRVLGVELPLRALFESPTISQLSERVERARSSGTEQASEQIGRVSRVAGANHELSFAQQRLWFLDQLTPGSSSYIIAGALQISGVLSVESLERSLADVVNRHEALRTRFESREGQAHQRIETEVVWGLARVDLSELVGAALEAETLRLLKAGSELPFDLERGPLFRGLLIKQGTEQHVLLLSMHHIVSDGWSLGVLLREVSSLYESYVSGRPSPLAGLEIQYLDYSVWQREWLGSAGYQEQLSYWSERLRGATPALELPTDRPRPTLQSARGGQVPIHLSSELTSGLRALSRRCGATLYMTLLAGFQTLLSRYSGQTDIVVGSPIAGRTRTETEGLIGFFANTLVLRSDLSGSPSFEQLLGQVKQHTLSAYEHQEVPFEQLVQVLAPERDLSRTPLFQVMFVLQNAPRSGLRLGSAELVPVALPTQSSKFDLTLSLEEHAEHIAGYLEYCADLFDASTVERFAAHLENLLRSIAAQPELSVHALPIVSDSERAQLLTHSRGAHTEEPARGSLHRLFEQHAAACPDQLAVVGEEGQLSYDQVNRRANRLARHLRERGVGPETRVALFLEPSLEMMIGLLGVLKAGAAYVPIDPVFPKERVDYILSDSEARLLISRRSWQARCSESAADVLYLDEATELLARHGEDNLLGTTRDEQAAYVIYTSGSTGQPKGVVVEQRQILNYLRAIVERFELRVGMHYGMLQPLAVDSSKTVLIPSLCAGGTLHVMPRDRAADPHAVQAYFQRHRLDVLKIAPSHLGALVAACPSKDLLPHQVLALGGEASPWTWLRDEIEPLAHARATTFIHYGPTETTVGMLTYRVERQCVRRGALVPTGRPLPNTQAYVLDKFMQPVPLGVSGEIYIGGRGVARGYLNRPDLTAERFVPDPFSDVPGARLYRTGDRARWLPDGNIEFIGRMDHQIKVRGYRVEPGEVAAALKSHPRVRDAIAIGVDDPPFGKSLIAYAVPFASERNEPASSALGSETAFSTELRNWLAARIPDYMVPRQVVLLEGLPLSAQGKVDLRALPRPVPDAPRLVTHAPRTVLEAQLVEIWEGLLGTGRVGVNDEFFDRGGHSLLSVRLLAAIRTRLGRSLSVVQLFRNPTIAKLAALLSEQVTVEDASALVPIQPNGSGAPFFCVHPVGGNVLCYVELARALGCERPFYGLKVSSDSALGTLEEIAARYVQEIRKVQKRGCYLLGGWSMGGLVALEMARQLSEQGERVGPVMLFDSHPPAHSRAGENTKHTMLERFAADLARSAGIDASGLREEFVGMSETEQRALVEQVLTREGLLSAGHAAAELDRMLAVFTGLQRAVERYSRRNLGQRAVLFAASGSTGAERLAQLWQPVLPELELNSVAGDHYSTLHNPHVAALAQKLRQRLERAERERGSLGDHRAVMDI